MFKKALILLLFIFKTYATFNSVHDLSLLRGLGKTGALIEEAGYFYFISYEEIRSTKIYDNDGKLINFKRLKEERRDDKVIYYPIASKKVKNIEPFNYLSCHGESSRYQVLSFKNLGIYDCNAGEDCNLNKLDNDDRGSAKVFFGTRILFSLEY